MVRTNLIRDRINSLSRQKEISNKYKKQLIQFLQKKNELLLKKELTLAEYKEFLSQKREGKTISEWIEYYEWFEKECERRIELENKNVTRKKIVNSAFLFLIISILLISFFYLSPKLSGFIINQNENSYQDSLGLSFSSPDTYVWTPLNNGTLTSVKISGNIQLTSNDGYVKIYLGNILIFNSDNYQAKNPSSNMQANQSTNLLTGFITSDINITDSQQSNIQEGASQNQTSPYQGKPSIDNSTYSYFPINYSFLEVCTENCDLSQLNVSQNSYPIKVELNNAFLSLNNISYSMINLNDVNVSENISLPAQNNISQDNSTANENITLNATIENQTDLQLPAEINKPVQWIRNIKAGQPGLLSLNLPYNAQIKNISSANNASRGFSYRQKNPPAKKGINSLPQVQNDNIIEFTADNSTDINVIYETPAPTTSETQMDTTHKIVTVTGPDSLHYRNVLTYANISTKISINSQDKIKLYWIVNGTPQDFSFNPIDSNNDGYIDQISWITPHLSNETFEIIIVTNAQHLDENRTFIEDIYDSVKALDNIWSPEIKNNEYIRVTFQENLTNKNDITLYPKTISGNPQITVFENNQTIPIATFSNIKNNAYNKVYLTNLQDSEDTFDLQVTGGSLEIDHIIDPTTSVTLVPNLLTGIGYNGTLTVNTLTTKFSSPLLSTEYSKLNTSGGTSSFQVGNTTLDSFFQFNFTLPYYSSISSIALRTISTTNGTAGEKLNITLWNYTSLAWKMVNGSNTSSPTAFQNFTLTYNITSANGLSNLVNGTSLVIRTHTTGTAATIFYLDYLEAVMNYNTDTNPPNVTGLIPAAATNYTSTQGIEIGANVTDDLGGGDSAALANITLPNGTSTLLTLKNLTFKTKFNTTYTIPSLLGRYNITFIANDTSNNINNTQTTYFSLKDQQSPSINLTYPLNTTYSTTINALNYTVSDTYLQACWYSLNKGATNTTITCGNNVTGLSANPGSNNWTIYANDTSGNVNSSSVVFYDNAGFPAITYIDAIPAQTINENSYLPVKFYFTAQDSLGVAKLNDTSIIANFTIAGNPVRSNSSCVKVGNIDSNNVNYSCTVNLWYFDTSGTWNIGISINDTSGNAAYNTTQTFTLQQTAAFVISPTSLIWNALVPGIQNQTATNDPIILNNTGNKPITVGNIQINATDLLGETDNSKGIYAENISFSTFTGGSPPVECNSTSTNMSTGGFVSIAGANLSTGNNSINDGVTGQERLYVCIRTVGSELSSQAYSTSQQGSWTVKILVMLFSTGNMSSKLRKKKKKIENDPLTKAITILIAESENNERIKESLKPLIEEFQKKNSLTENEATQILEYPRAASLPVEIFSRELGILEATCKYLRENYKMRYSEIAKVLQRDQRTIWVAYKKAQKKRASKIIIKESRILIPISILGNKNRTLMESTIQYCKEQYQMRYSEIAKVLQRDQRNIRSTYLKSVKIQRNV